MHHDANRICLDKNYAGVLIFWDKLFSTFTPETREPRYGIVEPLHSYNPIWINLHNWAEMFEAMRLKKGLVAKLWCVFGSPDLKV